MSEKVKQKDYYSDEEYSHAINTFRKRLDWVLEQIKSEEEFDEIMSYTLKEMNSINMMYLYGKFINNKYANEDQFWDEYVPYDMLGIFMSDIAGSYSFGGWSGNEYENFEKVVKEHLERIKELYEMNKDRTKDSTDDIKLGQVQELFYQVQRYNPDKIFI